jgi:hypothetical protein
LANGIEKLTEGVVEAVSLNHPDLKDESLKIGDGIKKVL